MLYSLLLSLIGSEINEIKIMHVNYYCKLQKEEKKIGVRKVLFETLNSLRLGKNITEVFKALLSSNFALTHDILFAEGIQEDDIDPEDLQPFPTLKRAFEAVDIHTGFNIEVKYPMKKVVGSFVLLSCH